MEFLTGTGLAVAAGLNAYIPLLILGLAGRFLDFVDLPANWAWLENPWVLGILGVLLVVEIVADKIPAVDSINDILQTVVRPVAGGIAFGTGSASGTAVVTDPAAFFTSGSWVPIAIGVVLALGTHLTKMAARPVLNVATALVEEETLELPAAGGSSFSSDSNAGGTLADDESLAALREKLSNNS